ncbi:MAG: disulfide bond chaperone [Clostridiales bacterium]|jgi:molecular chaperone Hsp33|nr:disulfide bond chaperone [Clostridiales bacterium]
MQDYIISSTAAEGTVRAFAAVTTNMVREAQKVHGLSPVASAALGRTITAAAIMSRSLKGEKDTLTIQIKGDGKLGGIVVVTDSSSNVRGYVFNPGIYIPLNEKGKLDVSTAIGKDGYMNVIKDLGMKEPYIGYVKLVSGEIAEDIAYYFASSEQVPTAVALGVLVNPNEEVENAGGFMIQLMPGAEDDIITYLETKIASVPSITKLLSEGKGPEDILEILLGEKSLKILERYECKYQCNCSRDRMERNLISLGKKELLSIIEEQKGAETQCHFCNTKYNFSEEDIKKLIAEE